MVFVAGLHEFMCKTDSVRKHVAHRRRVIPSRPRCTAVQNISVSSYICLHLSCYPFCNPHAIHLVDYELRCLYSGSEILQECGELDRLSIYINFKLKLKVKIGFSLISMVE